MARTTITYPVDGTPGEAIEETGEGAVASCTDKGQVTIDADHLDLPVMGWLSRGLPTPRVGQRIAYRVVVHRKRGVSAGIRFDDLSNRDKVRDLVGYTDLATGEAHGDVGRGPAAPTSSSTPPAPADDRPPLPDAPADDQGPPRAARSSSEPAPHVAVMPNGALNPGSYAHAAAGAMVSRAANIVREGWGIDAAREAKRIEWLADRLLHIADDLAHAVTGHTDRMGNAHTRARAAVFTALEVLPFTPEAIEQAGGAPELLVELHTLAGRYLAITYRLTGDERDGLAPFLPADEPAGAAA